MNARLDHANLTVRSLNETVHFLRTAFPHFEVRFDGTDKHGKHWIHIGTEDTYIALTESQKQPAQPWTPYAGYPGVNHLECEVNDVEPLRQRLLAAGYKESTVPKNHPYRRRVYFYDPDGNDWEFVQYLSSNAAKRNDSALPDE
jgi:catechol 2,3-dioxygenase-like lactoylglutathione lyase family enzyme